MNARRVGCMRTGVPKLEDKATSSACLPQLLLWHVKQRFWHHSSRVMHCH